ncbi:murein hydrolase activator EnvC [Actinotalea sp. Marseille-Q4924]|uniref:murein hydrolase activator EnvC family protein n=1 Tax=Actinotalea sp. Marseille-Q4924 TaxID=2866571 RepID=UPI001CE491CA|nr:M23 family metallopeptidase [Actinotalea sp. Marseille-Q4924]
MPSLPLAAAVGTVALGALLLGAPAPSPVHGAAERSAGAPSATEVVLPVEGSVLVREFAEPTVRWGPGHRGVDLAAAVGAAVRSPATGVVAFAGHVVDRGVVSVLHADGLRSSVEPVSAVAAVGTPVTAGEVVGYVTTGGHCSGCLHWGVRDGERYLDPLSLLSSGTVRLLPQGGAG